jgi:hypothetical protein
LLAAIDAQSGDDAAARQWESRAQWAIQSRKRDVTLNTLEPIIQLTESVW